MKTERKIQNSGILLLMQVHFAEEYLNKEQIAITVRKAVGSGLLVLSTLYSP